MKENSFMGSWSFPKERTRMFCASGGICERPSTSRVRDTDGRRGDLLRIQTWPHHPPRKYSAIPQPTFCPNGIFHRWSRFDPWWDLESLANAASWPMKLAFNRGLQEVEIGVILGAEQIDVRHILLADSFLRSNLGAPRFFPFLFSNFDFRFSFKKDLPWPH
jgi:hypothetical protein